MSWSGWYLFLSLRGKGCILFPPSLACLSPLSLLSRLHSKNLFPSPPTLLQLSTPHSLLERSISYSRCRVSQKVFPPYHPSNRSWLSPIHTPSFPHCQKWMQRWPRVWQGNRTSELEDQAVSALWIWMRKRRIIKFTCAHSFYNFKCLRLLFLSEHWEKFLRLISFSSQSMNLLPPLFESPISLFLSRCFLMSPKTTKPIFCPSLKCSPSLTRILSWTLSPPPLSSQPTPPSRISEILRLTLASEKLFLPSRSDSSTHDISLHPSEPPLSDSFSTKIKLFPNREDDGFLEVWWHFENLFKLFQNLPHFHIILLFK